MRHIRGRLAAVSVRASFVAGAWVGGALGLVVGAVLGASSRGAPARSSSGSATSPSPSGWRDPPAARRPGRRAALDLEHVVAGGPGGGALAVAIVAGLIGGLIGALLAAAYNRSPRHAAVVVELPGPRSATRIRAEGGAAMPGAVAAAPVLDPVVEPIRAALPELERLRHDEVPAPHRRKRDLVRVRAASSATRASSSSREPISWPWVDASPRAGCRADGCASRRASRHPRAAGRTADARLAIERRPPERGRGPWVGRHVTTLAAAAMRVVAQPLGVEPVQEHEADRRHAARHRRWPGRTRSGGRRPRASASSTHAASWRIGSGSSVRRRSASAR